MKKFILAVLLLTLSIVVTACFKEKDEDTWIVGTSADNPPFEFIQDGQIVGFDIDFINAVAIHLGKKVEIKNMDFHTLLAALASKNVDVVIAGLSVTADRQQRVDFSHPYTDARIAVLHRREDELKNVQDLKGLHVGAQLGSIWSLIAHDLALDIGFNVRSLASNLLLVEELKLKRIDALVLEEFQAEQFVKRYPEFGYFSVKERNSEFAIAMPKHSPLQKNVNHAIKALKSNGTLKALAEKWGLAGAE